MTVDGSSPSLADGGWEGVASFLSRPCVRLLLPPLPVAARLADMVSGYLSTSSPLSEYSGSSFWVVHETRFPWTCIESDRFAQ